MGDITLTGHDVRQLGVALSSTTVTARGTVHLLNSATDAGGRTELGRDSTTAILIEDDGAQALDAQRDALLRLAPDADRHRTAGQAFDQYVGLPDRRDQSRIEVSSGGTIVVQDGAMAIATGGQIALSAARRSVLNEGSVLDVAGAVGVKLAMESNNIKVNIQGNEQRDAPVSRDGKTLNNSDIWVDRRTLIQVAKGVNCYERERWYTQGGLLEVGGYLGTVKHGIGEWAAVGGTVTVAGGELISRPGSLVNISGGTLDVQSGYIRQSWLRGEDGRLYEVSRAPGDLLYKGLYKGFEDTHARWGDKGTRYFYNPLIGPRQRLEEGYTAGRDAGRLVVATRTASIEGSIVGIAFQGVEQTQARQNIDAGLRQQTGYQQSQRARSLAGQLLIGRYAPLSLEENGRVRWGYDLAAVTQSISILDGVAPSAVGLDDPLPAASRILLDASKLAGLGQITAVASDSVAVKGRVQMADAGAIELYAPDVSIAADLSARGGRIAAGNVFDGIQREAVLAPPANASARLLVAPGVALDVSGLWSNARREPTRVGDMAYRNGGQIALRGTGAVVVEKGADLNADAGASVSAAGKLTGGKGGDVTVEMARPTGSAPGPGTVGVKFDGAAHSYGVAGGGIFRLSTTKVRIGGTSVDAGGIVLSESLFQTGFSRYDINGDAGLEVANGAVLRPVMPVYRSRPSVAIGNAATQAEALELWTPPVFQEDPLGGRMTQRLGASLSLGAYAPFWPQPEGGVRIGEGALIEVDPGQDIRLRARGLLRISGTLRAPGGRIDVQKGADTSDPPAPQSGGLPNSVWLDDAARLDVAGIAATAVDVQGRRYGLQRNGGHIAVDGEFVVIRPGAVLEASGTYMDVDVPGAATSRLRIGGQGGTIALSAT
ncbi:MAG: hemagglutinin, partial [Achromobacter sp.]|nr:hemagglutinin [Achromobacter sp.]